MKLVMDLADAIPLRADMDEDRRDLIIRLCTHIGMIMEDASVLTLMVRGVTDDDLTAKISEIDAAVRQMRALISAAAALGASEE